MSDYRGGSHAHFPAAPSAASFFHGVTLTAVLAIIASFLPAVPAAQAQTPGSTRLETALVYAGAAYHRWSDNNGASWSSWTSLGAPAGHTLEGTPAVVSDGYGRLNIVSESDNGLWQIIYSNGAWSGWTKIPGQSNTGIICVEEFLCFTLETSPALASWGPGRMDLFLNGSGTDGSISLLHTWADNSSWSGRWERLGTGLMQGAPGAVSWGPGRVDVFVRGGGNELAHKWFDNGHWSSGWESLGGILTTPPAVASPGPGRLNIFTRGTDGHLWGIWFAGGWGGWGDTGCCLAGDVTNAVAAASRGSLTLDVFVIGVQHDLYSKHFDYYAGGWADWVYLNTYLDNIAATTWVPIAPPPPPPPPPPPKCGPTTGRPCPVEP